MGDNSGSEKDLSNEDVDFAMSLIYIMLFCVMILSALFLSTWVNNKFSRYHKKIIATSLNNEEVDLIVSS
jgi:hypothetical protein